MEQLRKGTEWEEEDECAPVKDTHCAPTLRGTREARRADKSRGDDERQGLMRLLLLPRRVQSTLLKLICGDLNPQDGPSAAVGRRSGRQLWPCGGGWEEEPIRTSPV